jgi:hypothetical protein
LRSIAILLVTFVLMRFGSPVKATPARREAEDGRFGAQVDRRLCFSISRSNRPVPL